MARSSRFKNFNLPALKQSFRNATSFGRKIKAALITMTYILVTMIVATKMGTPAELANNALWIIGLVGGVTVGGQALVDKVAQARKK